MSKFVLAGVLGVAIVLAGTSANVFAGPGGGGHGGGGHSSGGHSSGGHASSGHMSGGHMSGGSYNHNHNHNGVIIIGAGGYGFGYPYYSPSYYGSDYYGSNYGSGYYTQPQIASYYTPGAQPALTNPTQGLAAAEIEVHIPADAELWLDGNPTKQRGESRAFVSPLLQPGRNFVYEMRARWMQDGKPVEETRQIEVWAGARPVIDFRKK
jgi:uncharacterized protein (TIGR03000 family)